MVVIFCLLFATNTAAKEPQEFVEEFFKLIKIGKVSEAYNGLFEGSTIPASKPQAVEMLKRQTSSGLPLYGKILGHKNLRKEIFGESIIRLVYILKSETAPTVWEFYFYKPLDRWFLVKIMFNDEFKLIESKK